MPPTMLLVLTKTPCVRSFSEILNPRLRRVVTTVVSVGLTASSAALIKNVILVPHGIGDNAGTLQDPILYLTGDAQLGNGC